MDHTHNPEFTMLEYYWAYHKFEDLIKLTEDLFDNLFVRLNLEKNCLMIVMILIFQLHLEK